MITVMTIGYQDRTVDELVDALMAAAVNVLVDVRLTPISRKPGLSKHRLAARLREAGIDYLHMPQLGNPRDNRDAFRHGDESARERYATVLTAPAPRAALQELAELARRRRIALMCFERNASECHRAMALDALAGITGFTVEHL